MKRNTIKQIVFASTSSLVLAGVILVSPPFVKPATTPVAASSISPPSPANQLAIPPLASPHFAAGADDGGSDD